MFRPSPSLTIPSPDETEPCRPAILGIHAQPAITFEDTRAIFEIPLLDMLRYGEKLFFQDSRQYLTVEISYSARFGRAWRVRKFGGGHLFYNA